MACTTACVKGALWGLSAAAEVEDMMLLLLLLLLLINRREADQMM